MCPDLFNFSLLTANNKNFNNDGYDNIPFIDIIGLVLMQFEYDEFCKCIRCEIA